MAMSGVPTGADEMRTLVGFGHAGGLRVHVDGAGSGTRPSRPVRRRATLTGGADTVMFCLSKGLGAPVGSVLCGPADVIAEARLQRRAWGRHAPGGRDRGGGIVALETMVERLADDHARPRQFAAACRV